MEAENKVARAVSLGAATCLTWALNRHVTFARTGRLAVSEWARYCIVALVAQGFNYGLFIWLSGLFPHIYAQLLILPCAAAAAGLSYLGQRQFTFSQGISRSGGHKAPPAG